MRVAIYARYSSDKQNENTIEAQQRICREYCKRHNYEIVAYYTDRALTASKNVEKILEFQRMIKDSEKKKFDAVLVFKLERFARNRYDSAVYKPRLKKMEFV
jgi:site-specific DNA recombinase